MHIIIMCNITKIMNNELKEGKESFGEMKKDLLKRYFYQNLGCLLKGKIRIEEENGVVRIYKKSSKEVGLYDIGIIE